MDKRDPMMKWAVKRRKKMDARLLGMCRDIASSIIEPHIIDIGAWQGKFLFEMKKVNPKSKLYAVEPMDENLRILESHGIVTCKCAASSTNGTTEIYTSNRTNDGKKKHKDTSLFLDSVSKEGMSVESTSVVEEKSINEIFKVFGTRFDLMHMNCEGAEYIIFSGNTEWLKDIRYLYLHMHTKCSKFRSDSFIKNRIGIQNKLKSSGFKLVDGMTDMSAIGHIVQLWESSYE